MNNVDKFNVNEEDFREEIIKTIDKSDVKKNLAYQVLMNKLSLTPYLYELDEVDPLFVNYREKNKSKINNFVLHPFQVEILNKLNQGKNLIVSAPTSFGKTASVFEYLNINKNKINKILIILPTIALRYEYLEKIVLCIPEHKIISNSNKIEKYEKFCLILTHERFVEYFSKIKTDAFDIDLLVIDEIYKLQNESNSDRMYSMSLAYLTAIKLSKQYIFLGPFINSISLPDIENFEVLKYDYSPIAIDITYQDSFDLNSVKNNILSDEKTMMYFSNKKDLLDFAEKYIQNNTVTTNNDFIKYISEEYDEKWIDEWSVLKAIEHGIGVHYNELPSFIKEYVINSYNNSNNTMLLLSTSTLLEGVNTSTKKLIITSKKIGSNDLSDFEFWNLVGRAGRLGKYKVGKVTYFGKKDDFKKENRYIDLNNLWINESANRDEYEIINSGQLSDFEKQRKLEEIYKNYNLSLDEIKFLFLPFFSKVDKLFDFFDNIYPKLINKIEELLNKQIKNSDFFCSREIRRVIFEEFILKYKKTLSIGTLPLSHFSILCDAINMSNSSKNSKIKYIIDNRRNFLEKKCIDLSVEEKREKLNNLYSYSFYMVNNYIVNAYIPGVNIIKLLCEKTKQLNREQSILLNNSIFKQVDQYSSMINDEELFDTLGIISPLIKIIKETVGDVELKNISDLRDALKGNVEIINSKIAHNELYIYYFEMLLKKLQL